MKTKKPKLFLLWTELAIKVRESFDTPWNNAWISRRHGSLDFKLEGVPHLQRYLIGEIRFSGLNVTQQPNWQPSTSGATRHHAGTGYEGALDFPTAKAALQFLERYYTLVKCGAWPESL